MDKDQFYKGRADSATHLYIASIFSTVDGETNAFHAGTWSTFIRLQGCRVGCVWCDTKYSWPIHRNGMAMEPIEIIEKVRADGGHKVTNTGGEPMEQWGAPLQLLITWLHGWGYDISMETAGTEPLAPIIDQHLPVNLIVDWKMASASTVRPPILYNYAQLRNTDVVKIVTRLDEMKHVPPVVNQLRKLGCRARMVFSPVWDEAKQLQEFIKEARIAGLPQLDVGINLQMHKVIWPANVRDEEEAR